MQDIDRLTGKPYKYQSNWKVSIAILVGTAIMWFVTIVIPFFNLRLDLPLT